VICSTPALRQLLDNAVKYSPPTSTIRIAATGNGSVEISVLNSDSTIPEKATSRLFEFIAGPGRVTFRVLGWDWRLSSRLHKRMVGR
jgi:K+-sensing histidine kinase KdpD